MRSYLPRINYSLEGDNYEERKRIYDGFVYVFCHSSKVDDKMRRLIRHHVQHLRNVIMGYADDDT
ncbi:hypothetical protein GNI_155440 [Gregarina niphandrodes]|uniref:Uncharacterized protein n=1 Tax=Gregarina niphandrodes TaxID=110365 RepID=A0A023AZ67_GRENI|nr:hypothetical protein GNI_155440 [Gregarina niphandrodes]EZG43951.1 hypothetical protein GNI_155440 [Gregarina niphandrodes]|eukprot:XP_011132882.1 hypothetical protein GNI_155440 [Gregarina niphandrodes]